MAQRKFAIYQWITQQDEHVCDKCKRRHGRLYREARGERGLEGAAAQPHRGCRCQLRLYDRWTLVRWERYRRRGRPARRVRPKNGREQIPVPPPPGGWGDEEHEEEDEGEK